QNIAPSLQRGARHLANFGLMFAKKSNPKGRVPPSAFMGAILRAAVVVFKPTWSLRDQLLDASALLHTIFMGRILAPLKTSQGTDYGDRRPFPRLVARSKCSAQSPYGFKEGGFYGAAAGRVDGVAGQSRRYVQ